MKHRHPVLRFSLILKVCEQSSKQERQQEKSLFFKSSKLRSKWVNKKIAACVVDLFIMGKGVRAKIDNIKFMLTKTIIKTILNQFKV